MRVPVRKQGKPSGFTLVEMAIVLVIIGIILAGVMKGRDIVRGSQIKQFSQQFAQKWGTVAQTYYDKTGQFLNDGSANGGAAGNPNGQMDGTMAITAARSLLLMNTLNGVGVPLCTIVKSKLVGPVAVGGLVVAATNVCTDGAAGAGTDLMNPWQTTVDGEYAGGQTVTADLINLVITMQGSDTRRNCVILYNVPSDVCQGLDTVVDGSANGASGACIGINDRADAGTAPTALATGGTVTATAWSPATPTAGGAPGVQSAVIIMDY